MPGLTEIRWHARAGQGAKTASHVLALALLRSGKSVQSFPAYGPERNVAWRRFASARRPSPGVTWCGASTSTPCRRVGSKLTFAPGPKKLGAFGSNPISLVRLLR